MEPGGTRTLLTWHRRQHPMQRVGSKRTRDMSEAGRYQLDDEAPAPNLLMPPNPYRLHDCRGNRAGDAKVSEDSGRASALSASSKNPFGNPDGPLLSRNQLSSGSKRYKKSILSFGLRADDGIESETFRDLHHSNKQSTRHRRESRTFGWLRRCMVLRPSSRPPTPSTPLPVYSEKPCEVVPLEAPVPDFGFIPGFGYESPPQQFDRSRGAAARAAAAAQNEMLATMKNLSLAESRMLWDSKEYIGVETSPWPELISDHTLSASRKDPACALPPELMLHIFSFLDATNVLQAELVSRDWHALASSSHLWRHTYRKEFTIPDTTPVRPPRNWKEMWKTQKALQQRWRDGHAAAIYLEGHTDSVYCVQFDQNKIITGSRDCTVRVWDARNYECIKVLGTPARDRSAEARPLPMDTPLFGRRPFTKLFSPHTIASSTPMRGSLAHEGSILCLQYDEKLMVTGSSDGSLILWDIKADYTPYQRLRDHKSGVLDVCFDENYIVSCSKDASVKVWQRSTGALLRTLRGHRGPVNAVQLRENLVVSASGDSRAKLWNLTTGACVKEFPSKEERGMACVEFSPDLKSIFAGGNDQVIYQFDVLTGEVLREFTGHNGLVRSLHLDSPNGRIVSGSYDTSVKAFDVTTGQTLVSLSKWTSSWILSAKTDYRRIIATSQDSRAVIIDFGYGLSGIETLET